MKTRHATLLSLLLLPLILLPAGCSHGGRSVDTSFTGQPGDRSIRIFVTNRNFMDATIWAVHTGARRKLGVVTGKTEATFSMPWDLSTQLWLEVDMLAGGRCTTEALPVDPGDDLELVIDLDMNGSPLCR